MNNRRDNGTRFGLKFPHRIGMQRIDYLARHPGARADVRRIRAHILTPHALARNSDISGKQSSPGSILAWGLWGQHGEKGGNPRQPWHSAPPEICPQPVFAVGALGACAMSDSADGHAPSSPRDCSAIDMPIDELEHRSADGADRSGVYVASRSYCVRQPKRSARNCGGWSRLLMIGEEVR